MIKIVLGIAGMVAAILGPKFVPNRWQRLLVMGVAGLFSLLMFASTSFVVIGQDSVGQLKRIYLAANLPPGKIIASRGQKGPQADILGPGFHFSPFIQVLHDIEELPVTEVKDGEYGILVAKDGVALGDKQFIADAWGEGNFASMLNAQFFLTDGKGQKGPQLDVLRPGKYRLNRYLFAVRFAKTLDVPTGHVAVVRSNVQTAKSCADLTPLSQASEGKNHADLSAALVAKGCIGVWDEPLFPGRYYLNEQAYVTTIIPTRVQTWTYQGGYTTRKINLKVGDNGKILQEEEPISVAQPPHATDRAINVRVEGWTIPVDMRVVVQVHPKDAPRVVASVGDMKSVEDNVITPAIRDMLRTIGGQAERKVLDFITKRDEIVRLVTEAITPEGAKAGVTIREIHMGEPAIPPELLVATLREQLATQLKETYKRERESQEARIQVERERATADQQDVLVKAEIDKRAAEHTKEKLRLEGEGEKLRLLEIAQGQKVQVEVLGQERVLQLEMLKEVLKAAVANPDLVKVPQVWVSGANGDSLAGAAAVLGASNLAQSLRQPALGKPSR